MYHSLPLLQHLFPHPTRPEAQLQATNPKTDLFAYFFIVSLYMVNFSPLFPLSSLSLTHSTRGNCASSHECTCHNPNKTPAGTSGTATAPP